MNLHERENRLCQLPRVSYDPGGPVEGERGREGFVLISEAHPPGQAAVMAAGGGVWPSRLPFQPQRSSVLAT